MMSDQYQQTFTTTDGQNNVTYIQFIHPNANLYCKEEIQEEYLDQQEYDDQDEAIEESYIDEDPVEETIEVLESIAVGRKKVKKDPETYTTVTKKLIQKNVTGMRDEKSFL
jgi:hypothetical protein